MASSLPLSYELSVVLSNGTELLLPSIHPCFLSTSENRCESCSTIWGQKPHDEGCIEYPFVMLPCQHIVGSACLGRGLKEERPACPVCNTRIQFGKKAKPLVGRATLRGHTPMSMMSGSGSEDESETEELWMADDETSDSRKAGNERASPPRTIHLDSSADASMSVTSGSESDTDRVKETLPPADSGSSDTATAHRHAAGRRDTTSNIRTAPVGPPRHASANDMYDIQFTPINRPARRLKMA